MIWHNDMTWWHVNRIDGWGWEEGGRGGGEEGRGIVGIVVEIDRWDEMRCDQMKRNRERRWE